VFRAEGGVGGERVSASFSTRDLFLSFSLSISPYSEIPFLSISSQFQIHPSYQTRNPIDSARTSIPMRFSWRSGSSGDQIDPLSSSQGRWGRGSGLELVFSSPDGRDDSALFERIFQWRERCKSVATFSQSLPSRVDSFRFV
jgi:hypothetical protein